MTRTNIYLDPRQIETLDHLAAEEGISRAELIRRLLAGAIAERSSDVESDLAAIDDSFGALSDVEPLIRQRDERSAHLDRVWQIGA